MDTKNGNGKKNGKGVAAKPKALPNVPLAEVKPKSQPKANGEKGTQILLDAIRKAGRIGLTMPEIVEKYASKMPNKNPKAMIGKTLKPYFLKKGWVKLQGDRFIIAEKK